VPQRNLRCQAKQSNGTYVYDALHRQTSADSNASNYNGDGVLVQENATRYV
jgi:hypothetical protein